MTSVEREAIIKLQNLDLRLYLFVKSHFIQEKELCSKSTKNLLKHCLKLPLTLLSKTSEQTCRPCFFIVDFERFASVFMTTDTERGAFFLVTQETFIFSKLTI